VSRPAQGVGNGRLGQEGLLVLVVHHRAVVGVEHGVEPVGPPAHLDALHHAAHGFPPAGVPVRAAGAVLKFQLIKIEHVGCHVGYAPSHVFVEADDDQRRARNGDAVHVHARGVQLNLVPNAGQVQLQVRVVGQQGIARGRLGAAHREVVGAQFGVGLGAQLLGRVGRLKGFGHGGRCQGLEIQRRAHGHNGVFPGGVVRKQVLGDGRAVLAQDVAHAQIVGAPAKIPGHKLEQQRAFQRLPGLGAVVEQLVLEGQRGGRELADVGIHARRVRLQHHPGGGVGHHHPQRVGRAKGQAHAPKKPVGLEPCRPHDFGQPPGRYVGLKLHLPEPVAGREVTLGEVQVVVVLRKYVRHAAVVVAHGHGRLQAGQGQGLPGREVVGAFAVLPEAAVGAQQLAKGRHVAVLGIERPDEDEARRQGQQGFDHVRCGLRRANCQQAGSGQKQRPINDNAVNWPSKSAAGISGRKGAP